MKGIRTIPGVNSAAVTDMPVLKPFRAEPSGAPDSLIFSRWIANTPAWVLAFLIGFAVLWPIAAVAQSKYTTAEAFDALWRWMPLLVFKGFGLNILISFLTMAVGTFAGIVVGLGQISPNRIIERISWFITQLFRNSPWLVLLFIVMLAFPFEIKIGSTIISLIQKNVTSPIRAGHFAFGLYLILVS